MPYSIGTNRALYLDVLHAWCACYREPIGAMVEHPWRPGYSNVAHFKTSDQANAIMWLRYMLVYAQDGTLHFGRAVPRAWLGSGQGFGADRVATVFGTAGVRYEPALDRRSVTASVSLKLRRRRTGSCTIPHPDKSPIRSVKVDGAVESFDPRRGTSTSPVFREGSGSSQV